MPPLISTALFASLTQRSQLASARPGIFAAPACAAYFRPVGTRRRISSPI